MISYYLITFGCQMNKSDSERIVSLLDSLGLSQAEKVDDADLIIINTCSVRQAAEDRVYGFVHNWQKLRKKNSKLVIAITGCMPGRDKDGKLKQKIKGVDLFFPIQDLIMLPKWLEELGLSVAPYRGAKFCVPIGGVDASYLQITPQPTNNFQSFITIQTGCNNHCTYCVVPHARGPEKNRPVEDILSEIEQVVKNGCKEVVLLGQVVNNYKASDINCSGTKSCVPTNDHFANLLHQINQIKGLERIHFTAPDPQYFSNDQIEALKLPKQVNYLHLPVQSGDNNILKKMNRKYTREQYIELIKKIKIVKPDIALGTDLIVGFPGETKEQFQNTLDLYRQCEFDISYPAMYSERSGTAAAKAFKDDVSHEEKKLRWRMIQELMEEITFRKNQEYVEKIVSVLVEECHDNICSGHSNEMKLVQFLGDKELVGQIVNVKVAIADIWILRGKLTKGQN